MHTAIGRVWFIWHMSRCRCSLYYKGNSSLQNQLGTWSPSPTGIFGNTQPAYLCAAAESICMVVTHTTQHASIQINIVGVECASSICSYYHAAISDDWNTGVIRKTPACYFLLYFGLLLLVIMMQNVIIFLFYSDFQLLHLEVPTLVRVLDPFRLIMLLVVEQRVFYCSVVMPQ